MRTMREWYEWMRRDSLAQIEALEAEDRLIDSVAEGMEWVGNNGERIALLHRHIAEIDDAIRRLSLH
jgi:hypothetical protein